MPREQRLATCWPLNPLMFSIRGSSFLHPSCSPAPTVSAFQVHLSDSKSKGPFNRNNSVDNGQTAPIQDLQDRALGEGPSRTSQDEPCNFDRKDVLMGHISGGGGAHCLCSVHAGILRSRYCNMLSVQFRHRNWFCKKNILSFGSHSGPLVQRIAAETG